MLSYTLQLWRALFVATAAKASKFMVLNKSKVVKFDVTSHATITDTHTHTHTHTHITKQTPTRNQKELHRYSKWMRKIVSKSERFCVCVCGQEKEREREREGYSKRYKERDRHIDKSSLHCSFFWFLCCFSSTGVYSDHTSSFLLRHRYLFRTFYVECPFKLCLSHYPRQVKP